MSNKDRNNMHSLLRRSSRLFITLAFAALLSACNTGGTTSQSEGNNTAVGGLSNHAPIIQGTPTTSIVAGSAYSFQPVATDPDEDTLVFSITNQPAWASFNTSTGLLSGTPQNANVGLYTDITISAS
ncbi:MAG: putative Ig domain-containing protein, partial [Chromatiales bacterium]|nr:putative Ig domain-containing protein [Chromatiales bacterium]